MGSFIQSDFSGGMNLFQDDTNLAPNQYSTAFNVRNRSSGLSTIKSPIEDTLAPAGKKQGIYAFDKFLLLFVNGLAYTKNILNDIGWIKINDFILDPTVDYIYTSLIPASTNGFKRTLITDSQVLGSPQSIPLKFELINSTSSVAGLVVQDGINQPWFIRSDGTAIRLQKYSEWALTAREYVPIMKQMIYNSGILFGIAPDGKTIYRSVSDRPLDFVVNVTTTGDKGGDASTTSYGIGFNIINCLNTNTDGDLLLATDKGIVILELNFNKTLFAEPTFITKKQYAIGIVNQFSFVKYSDAYHFLVDKDGIRTFSAEQNTDVNENRNSVFNSMISGAVSINSNPIKQTLTAVVIFNDFTIFSCKTRYSSTINYLPIYDNTRQQWVSIDSMPESIKMFAVADQSENPTLYAISEKKLYKLFSGNTAVADVSFRGINSGTAGITQKLDNLNTVFYNGTIAGTVYATEYENGIENKTITERLDGKNLETLRFNYMSLANQCWKSQTRLKWQNDSKLILLENNTTPITTGTTLQQMVKSYATS